MPQPQVNPAPKKPQPGSQIPNENSDAQKSSEKNAGQFEENNPQRYGSEEDEDVANRQQSEWQTPGNDSFPGVENGSQKAGQDQGIDLNSNPTRRWL